MYYFYIDTKIIPDKSIDINSTGVNNKKALEINDNIDTSTYIPNNRTIIKQLISSYLCQSVKQNYLYNRR